MSLDEAPDAPYRRGYTATRRISAGFAMADVSPTAELRLIGGARFERSNLDVGVGSKVDPYYDYIRRRTNRGQSRPARD